MVKVDLITGFLGSGKTTFLKKYVKYLVDKGLRVGILENDYGAVNVDMLLLQELRSDKCELEMVSGGGDSDCHKRRFKTKLIAMGMSGYDRVIIEPSGIFDVDEFFDTLREEPLDNWYEIGNVITIVDANLQENMSQESRFFLASQASCAGSIVLSKTQYVGDEDIENTIKYLNESISGIKCNRQIDSIVIAKEWNQFDNADFEKMLNSGYKVSDYVKTAVTNVYNTLYFLDLSPDFTTIKDKVKTIFENSNAGEVFRIKGFYRDNQDKWFELNATANEINVSEVNVGQDVFIVIGSNLNEDIIKEIL